MWPTWESGRARDALATLIESLAADAQCLIDAYVNPTDLDADVLRQSRHAARLARSNAEASIERMLDEPERQRRVPAHTAVSVLASARRYALAALALHARIEAHPEPPRSSLAPLRDQIVVSLERLARAVREDVLAESLPGLRRTYLMLPATDTDGIGAELDMMIDSINTMAALLQAT
jgi:hypothetical protein